MKINQILESISAGVTGTNSIATAPSKTGKIIRRQKPADNALDSGKLFQETNTAEDKQKGVDGKACWKGYKRMGTKQKGGRTVDNCVKMEDTVDENKKGVRAVQHTTKPRNFVAKNAAATTSGAGAHKDKKKAMKQGETKHKGKEPAYESKLWAALDRKIIK
jgi:hypothetical protein